jgi:hypothetical protein
MTILLATASILAIILIMVAVYLNAPGKQWDSNKS